MFSLSEFHNTYETVTVPVVIDDLVLSFYKPASIDRFINKDNPMDNFPMWAKVWEASAMLASHLYHLQSNARQTMLEIGCGLGMTGIAAAKAGHRVTMTEINPDALDFARANAHLNGCPDIPIASMDWNAPRLSGRFDYIFGSATVYKQTDIAGLERLFDRYLKPGGTIILGERIQRTTHRLFERLQADYCIQVQKKNLRAEERTHHLVLFRLTRKSDA
jgi:predicted nicotinamide N-methyase